MRPFDPKPFALVGWCALASVFVLETIVSIIFPDRLPASMAVSIGPFGPAVPVIGPILFLPFLAALIVEAKRDFRFAPLVSRERIIASLGILPLLAIAFLWLGTALVPIVFLSFAVAVLAGRMGGRVPFVLALAFLALCPLFYVGGFPARAETLATYSYWCLAIGVWAEIFESWLSSRVSPGAPASSVPPSNSHDKSE